MTSLISWVSLQVIVFLIIIKTTIKPCSSWCDSKTTVDEKYWSGGDLRDTERLHWMRRRRRRLCSCGQRSTVRGEQDRGSWKGKLGHVEKSSCNDPNEELANSLHICLSSLSVSIFYSFSLKLHLSLFSDTQLSCFVFYSTLSFYFPPLPFLRQPLFIPPFSLPFPSLHPLLLISSSNRECSSGNQLWKRRTNSHTSSTLDILRSNFTSKWVTLVQCDISQAQAQR